MQKPVERLKRKVQKENMWFFICCLLEKRDRYGYEIRGMIREQFGFLAGTVTAYKVLYLLRKGKYVTLIEKDGKKYYHLTKEGRTQLRAGREFFATLRKL